jgi:hypothetical protein
VGAVVADMVEGVVAANRLAAASARPRRAALWRAVAAETSRPSGHLPFISGASTAQTGGINHCP